MIELLSFLAIGGLAGVLAGLLGIGGGIVTIPCLIVVFNYLGFPSSDMMHLAIGTTLAAMVFTTFSAALSHHKRKAVIFSILRPMSIGIVLGGAVGAFIAKVLSGGFLQVFFGLFESLIGVWFLLPELKVKKTRTLPSFFGLSTIAFGVSTLSTMLGLGGGTINVPILTHYHVSLKKAIGTSSALSFLVALTGGLFFVLFGLKQTREPETLGFVYLPAFVTISIGAFFTAPLGVRLAHYLPAAILRRVFGVALLIIGLSMIIF